MTTKRDYLLDDAQDLTQCGKVLLVILNFSPTKVTRIHKLSLFINSAIQDSCEKPDSHGAYHFGGFSEEMDSALTQFLEDGVATKIDGEFKITDYGKQLINILQKDLSDPFMLEVFNIGNPLLKSLMNLSDKQLLRLTYQLFPETTTHSVIKKEVERDNRPIRVGDMVIYKGKKEDLKTIIDKMRNEG